MNVKPISTLDPRINEIRELTARIVNKEVLPNERTLAVGWRHEATAEERAASKSVADAIKEKVKQAGLWAPHLPPEYGGAGFSFLEHAYMNEVLAYTTGGAALFGVVAPNSGNQTILLKYGTEEQKRQWLVPLTEGKMESGFSMTEPDSPGSDPRAIKTTARLENGEWVINGHKWFTSNGFRADFLIVMCRTEGAGRDTGRMTQIIVPTKTPGLRIVRGVEVWGRPSDHCEIVYDNVRVPEENALGAAGSGHQAAQDRLGAGRVFHCMNSIGQMWRAFDLMVERASMREVHGGCWRLSSSCKGSLRTPTSTSRPRG
jgi:acyl-CoA dehydrogenase